jgi:hypothetical protein
MTATNGLGLLGHGQVKLAGKTLTADVTEAIANIELKRTIDGASTLTFTLKDVSRSLLRSPLFAQRTVCTVDGLTFELVQIVKSADRLSATFESAAVAALRRAKGVLVAAPNTTTRGGFAARLLTGIPGVTLSAYADKTLSKVPLARGSATNKTEDTWTALTRLAAETNWRCFEVNGKVMFGPDSWLLSQPSLGTIRENTDGVDTIDFDYDVGKPLTRITVACVAAAWAVPPGSPVTLAGVGVANGPKIVSTINRSLFFEDANLTLTAPQAALPPPTA